MKTVIFACVHDAGRSQMAAAFFNASADADIACAVSAGTQPALAVHPGVVTAMLEAGVDLSKAQPRLLTTALGKGATLLITMGCKETCPVMPGVQKRDWALDDPKGLPLDGVRAIRDEIERRVQRLVVELSAP